MTNKEITDTKHSMSLFILLMIKTLEAFNYQDKGKGSPKAIKSLYEALECLKYDIREHTISTLDTIEPSKFKIDINKILKSGGRNLK